MAHLHGCQKLEEYFQGICETNGLRNAEQDARPNEEDRDQTHVPIWKSWASSSSSVSFAYAQERTNVTAVNYLFPPDQMENLLSWRFVLHFIVPPSFGPAELAASLRRLSRPATVMDIVPVVRSSVL